MARAEIFFGGLARARRVRRYERFRSIDLQWFAAEDEGRTEEPSETKLRRARQEEGRVPKSQELNSAIVMIFAVAALIVLAPLMLRECVEIFKFFFNRCAEGSLDSPVFASAFFNFYLRLVLPVAVVGAVGAVAGNILQNREFIFTLKTIQPNFAKIIPKFGEYFKNTIFSLRGAFNIAKSIGKVLILAAVSFLIVSRFCLPSGNREKDRRRAQAAGQNVEERNEGVLAQSREGAATVESLGNFLANGAARAVTRSYLTAADNDKGKMLFSIRNGGVQQAMSFIAGKAAMILVIAAVFFLLISIPDYFVQRKEFMEQMKMTKQEVKEELKEEEGDPEVKGYLQKAQRQLLQQNIPKAVRESDVVITNPTHFAVSLKYESDTMDAPQVMAKGEDNTAALIKRIARENNVPIVENRPLARALYTETEVGDIIPDVYIRAIANVYRFIHYKSKK